MTRGVLQSSGSTNKRPFPNSGREMRDDNIEILIGSGMME
jgi:hypothetical protein